MTSRNDVFDALFALGVGAYAWKYTSRRLQIWTECPAQPAFYQVEHDPEYSKVTGLPYRRVWRCTWIVYQNAATDPSVVGGALNAEIMDALDSAIEPRPVDGLPYDHRQTLGGLVYDCKFDGQGFQDGGDLDGQGLITIPIAILVP